MTSEHNIGHSEFVDNQWEKTGGSDPLRRYGGFQGLFDAIPDKERLVTTITGAMRYAVCIDERLIGSQALLVSVTNNIRMAGEGILNPNAEQDLKRAGVSGIIAHRSCGAKAIFAKEQDGNADEIGLVAVRSLADRVGIPVVQTIRPEEFRTPLHDARAIYYDGTDGARFDWSRVEDFPVPGFIVSRAILSLPEYAQTEVDVAIGIAQGQHGFGKRFTDAAPLYLVGVTDNQPGSIRAEVLARELKEVAANHQRVVVQGVLTA